MGILNNHIPVLTGLDVGVIYIRTTFSNEWIIFVVMGGFALVNNNKVTILVNEAELGSDIDRVEAEQTFLTSKASLDFADNGKKKIELESQFKRARVRYSLFSQKKPL